MSLHQNAQLIRIVVHAKIYIADIRSDLLSYYLKIALCHVKDKRNINLEQSAVIISVW